MAARDKKAPTGSGSTSKRLSSTASPIPLREPPVHGTSTPTTVATTSSSPVPTEIGDKQVASSELDQDAGKRPATVVPTKKVNKKEDTGPTMETDTPTTEPSIPATATKAPPKRGRRVFGKKRAAIKTKFKRNLKAKKVASKNISIKSFLTSAKAKLAETSPKKAVLLKNGIRNTRVHKTVDDIKKEDESEILQETIENGKRKTGRKSNKKIQSETVEHIPTDEIKQEVIESELVEEIDTIAVSTDSNTSTPKKVRRVVKKSVFGGTRRVANRKQTSAKKQKIVDSIAKDTKLDLDAQNVIDHLDLNVTANVKKTVTPRKRRHSIEKLEFTYEEQPTTLPHDFSQFAIIPRSGSPRSKRASKVRQSIDVQGVRTRSPYSTRSDSPARILRNGKHRKLKEFQLLDGIESEYKKRRRVVSDSRDGSEQKYSGYLSESESSYCESTISAFENGTPDIQMDVELLKTQDIPSNIAKVDVIKKDLTDASCAIEPTLMSKEIELSTSELTSLIKRSYSTDSPTYNKDVKVETLVNVDNENNNTDDIAASSKLDSSITELIADHRPLSQLFDVRNADDPTTTQDENVPEKILILNQMAQNFNDVSHENDPSWNGRRTTRASWRKSMKGSEETSSSETLAQDEGVSVKTFYGEGATGIEKTAVDALPAEDSAGEANKLSDNKLEISYKTIVEECNNEERNKNEIGALEDTSMSLTEESSGTTVVSDYEAISEIKSVGTETNNQKDDQVAQSSVAETVLTLSKPQPSNNDVKSVVEDEVVDDKKENSIPTDTDESILAKINKEIAANDSVLKALDLNKGALSIRAVIAGPAESKEGVIGAEKDATSMEAAARDVDTVGPSPAILITETPENQRIKESILSALGLQSLAAAAEAKIAKSKVKTDKNDPYTGTLKTVIKLNRSPDKKKGRGHLKMTFQKSRSKGASYSNGGDGFEGAGSSPDGDNTYYKVMKEVNAPWNTGGQSSDTAGANRKSHYSSNRSNTDGSSEHMSDEGGNAEGEEGGAGGTGKAKVLVIPEKASSFSIHPQRLCRDECCYCFGRFGLFDTPCHIAQIKSSERQRKILEIEKHLTPDSCLCDACYRHVDRKANVPSYNKQYKRGGSATSTHVGPRSCHAQGCQQDATHTVRRKWVLKMKRDLQQHIQIDLGSTPGLHLIPVCENHYGSLERLMACAMCKRRLTRNNALVIKSAEAERLNAAFQEHKLPICLATAVPGTSTESPDDKGGGSVVCRLCRYYAVLMLTPPDTGRPHTLTFFATYKKRLLRYQETDALSDVEIEEPIPVPTKKKDKPHLKKNKKSKVSKNGNKQNELVPTSGSATPATETSAGTKTKNPAARVSTDSVTKDPRVPLTNEIPEVDEPPKSRSNSPIYNLNTLSSNSVENSDAEVYSVRTNKSEVPHKPLLMRRLPKDSKYVVELHKLPKDKKAAAANNNAVERLETNPSISVRQLFPGEDDLPLQGNVDFGTVKERTPEGWEKSSMTIQYDHDTKRLWQELQKPYGNHSSFLRHLILLEKYFRNGDLVLTANASHHSTNYCESVQNRLRAYDNIPTHGTSMQPLAMLPFNNNSAARNHTISQSGIITGSGKPNPSHPKTSTPISFANISPRYIPPMNIVRQRSPSVPPPGLIQLQPGAPRPARGALIRLPGNKKSLGANNHANKVHKPWRPTLIPVTQNKVSATVTSGALAKQIDSKGVTSLVQVMSGGKCYNISIQDYNRMCLLRRECELRKKKQPESSQSVTSPTASGAPIATLSTVSVLRQRSPVASTSTATTRTSTPMEFTNNKNVLEHLHIKPLAEQTPGQIADTPVSEPAKKPVMILPKIPKSLTVIPQTVRRSTESQAPNLSVVSFSKTS